MLDITLLGTGGMMPLVNRYLTSCLIKYNSVNILIDCGEATQIALRNANESSKNIDVICITHVHADHISGIVGMLLLMSNQGKTSPLTIIGPKGIRNIVEKLKVIAPALTYTIKYVEISETETSYKLGEILNNKKFNDLTINAFRVLHKITCYGYSIKLDRLPKFNVEKAESLNIDKKYWNRLQHGETLTIDNIEYTPDMVMDEVRRGLKFVYVTDTRPCKSIYKYTIDADLFICEGMYGDEVDLANAIEKKHMLMSEAALIAKKSGVKTLWLTHYSPAMTNPKMYKDTIRNIFKNTIVSTDGQKTCLKFDN